MIGLLEGTVTNGCVLTACGVGYVVHTVEELTEGARVRLVIHQVLSESSSTLYGFRSTEAREVFLALLRIQGVAGKTAISLLADLGVAGLVRAVATKDTKALATAKGVGPKLATKIVTMATLPQVELGEADGGPVCDDLTDALVALGYPPSAAAAAAAQTRTETAGADIPVDQQLKVALAHLRAA